MQSVVEEPSDNLKNDFQNASRRNLRKWSEWRAKLNENLAKAALTGSKVKDVESFERFMAKDCRNPKHPTTNPKILLSYSASEDSNTSLSTDQFFRYGIPRVKLDPLRSRRPPRNPVIHEENGAGESSTEEQPRDQDNIYFASTLSMACSSQISSVNSQVDLSPSDHSPLPSYNDWQHFLPGNKLGQHKNLSVEKDIRVLHPDVSSRKHFWNWKASSNFSPNNTYYTQNVIGVTEMRQTLQY